MPRLARWRRRLAAAEAIERDDEPEAAADLARARRSDPVAFAQLAARLNPTLQATIRRLLARR